MKSYKIVVGAWIEGGRSCLWEVEGTKLEHEKFSYEELCAYLVLVKRFLDGKGIRYKTAKTYRPEADSDYTCWCWIVSNDNWVYIEKDDEIIKYFYYIHKDDVRKLSLKEIDLPIVQPLEVYYETEKKKGE